MEGRRNGATSWPIWRRQTAPESRGAKAAERKYKPENNENENRMSVAGESRRVAGGSGGKKRRIMVYQAADGVVATRWRMAWHGMAASK